MRLPGILPSHEGKLLSLQEEIDRLDRLTESLLLLTHLDTGHAKLERISISLSALVRETCEDAEMLGASRQILMKTDIAENVRVLGDANHLRRVLLNLLDNSTKYNVAGGFSQCVLSCEVNQAVLRVINTGPGIPIELKPRVFQRFFRAELSRNSEKPGSGLGLSISREIARAHGGDLLIVDSANPGWTELKLVLPLN